MSKLTNVYEGFQNNCGNRVYQYDCPVTSVQIYLGSPLPEDSLIRKKPYCCIEHMDNNDNLECFVCTLAAAEEAFNKINTDFPGMHMKLNRELSGDSHA